MSNTQTADEQARNRRRRATQATFTALLLLVLRRMDAAFERFARNEIKLEILHSKLHNILERGHARAAYLGRMRAGDTSPFDEADREYGAHVATTEETWLDPFVQDIRAGKYGAEEFDTEALSVRAVFYVLKLRATANEAFASTLADDTMIYWRLGGDEGHHCGDCPHFAEQSPYRASELPAYPSDGTTECVTLCNCFLETENGVNGFQSVVL